MWRLVLGILALVAVIIRLVQSRLRQGSKRRLAVLPQASALHLLG